MNQIIDLFGSETAYWVAQNIVGAVIPLVFVLVPGWRFPLGCIGIVFYGITSQTMSSNNTIGGRIIGASMFMGATLSGGLIGFSIVSLSWLARGPGVKSLLEVGHELQLAKFGDYFKGKGDFYDAIELVYNDIELILEADTTGASAWFWVLLFLLFAIMSIPWAWGRSTGETSMKTGVSILGMCLTCTLTIFGLLIPVTGQYAFWTLVFGGFLKASCISMLGTILSGLVIYVKSSHDELRKCYARAIKDVGKTMCHVTSCMRESMHVAACCNVPIMDVPLESLSHIIDFDHKMRNISIKSYLKMLKELQDSNGLISSCKTEPPIPGFSSQWGSNIDLYAQVGASIEDVISQLGCIEVVYYSIRKNMENAADNSVGQKEQTSWITSEDVPAGLHIVERIAIVCASMASVLQSSSDALSRMPVFQPCSGNSISWRPRPREFWVDLYRQLLLILDDKDMSRYLKQSGISGIGEILGDFELDSMPFRLGGSSLVLLTAVESLIDYCIQLDQRIANALNITDRELFDAPDVHKILKESLLGKSLDSEFQEFPRHHRDKKRRIFAFRTSPTYKAIVMPVLVGTGILGIIVYVLGCLDMIKRGRALLWPSMVHEEPKQEKSRPTFRQMIFFAKYWFGQILFVTGVLLIGWLAVGDTGYNLENQKKISEYLIKWMPFNAPIAIAICLNPTIDATIIKIFLRSTMISLGGVLGYLTMLNGHLAQNPYYVFWMAMIANAFFSLFSSMGSSTRYSIFLIVYTYFSVVACQYTGRCCEAGDVWEFAGRTITTIAGASFALAFNWLIMPTYSSQNILDEESMLLSANMKTVEESFEQGPDFICQNNLDDLPNGEENSIDCSSASHDGMGNLRTLYNTFAEKTSSSYKLRLSVASKIFMEKQSNSLDGWRFFMFDITLIPLPLACKLSFIRIARMGIHINICLHAIKSSIYPNGKGGISEHLFSRIGQDTADLLKTTQRLYLLIEACLAQVSPIEYSKIEIQIRSILALIVDIRSRLSEQFASSVDGLGTRDITICDLKCFVFLQYFYASLDEMHHLGLEMCKNEKMKLRDSYFSFVVAIAREESYISLEA